MNRIICLLLFLFSSCANHRKDFDIRLLEHPTFIEWLDHYQSFDSGFSADKFRLTEDFADVSGPVFEPCEPDTGSDYAALYVYSPNRDYYLDFNSDDVIEDGVYLGSDIDTQVYLVDDVEKKAMQVAFFGSGGSVEDAFWHNDSTYVLLGRCIDYDSNSSPERWFPFVRIQNMRGNILALYEYEKSINVPNNASYFEQRLINKGIKIADE